MGYGVGATLRISWLAALAGLACATGEPAPQNPVAQTLLAREVPLLDPIEVTAPDGEHVSQLPLPFEIGTTDAGVHEIVVPVEGSTPIVCFVWQHESELGVTVARTSDLLFENLAQQLGEITAQQISGIEAGAIDGSPFHAMNWVYRIGAESLGVLKVAAANRQGRGIACNHYDAGFSRTFGRVFLDLVEGLQVADPPAPAYYSEVAVVRMNDLPVGVEFLRFSFDETGDTRVDLENSSLVPTSATEVISSYGRGVEWARPDGTLINAHSRSADTEGTHTDLTLSRNAERGWYVQGKLRGKALDVDLAHEGSIDNTLSEAQAMVSRLEPHGDESSIVLDQWIPDVDPTTLLEVKTDLFPDDPTRVSAQMGPLRMTGVRDATGLVESGVVEAGRLRMTFERVYQDGGF